MRLPPVGHYNRIRPTSRVRLVTVHTSMNTTYIRLILMRGKSTYTHSAKNLHRTATWPVNTSPFCLRMPLTLILVRNSVIKNWCPLKNLDIPAHPSLVF
jgi:hypothetical protein